MDDSTDISKASHLARQRSIVLFLVSAGKSLGIRQSEKTLRKDYRRKRSEYTVVHSIHDCLDLSIAVKDPLTLGQRRAPLFLSKSKRYAMHAEVMTFKNYS